MYELKSLASLLLLIAPSLAAPEANPQWSWFNQGQNPAPKQPQQQPQPGFNPYQPFNAYQPVQQPTGVPYAFGGNQQAPRPTKTDDDEPKWTPPPQWGPKTGRQPFGPKSPTIGGPPGAITGAPKPQSTRPDYCSNTDVICTTTIEAPREPVPFKVTCGRLLYLEDDVSNALTAGCFYVKNKKKIGNSDYPKIFENRQRFDFGPVGAGAGQVLYEMPLIGSAAYAGGPVGEDRVIFSTPDCFLAGEVTQQNAGQRGYTECTEQY